MADPALEPDWAARQLLRAFVCTYRDPLFIEIGANGGDHHDHLRPLILSESWRGIMVEPVPYLFRRLRRNYGEVQSVALENLAIADENGERPFFHVVKAGRRERKRLPKWYDGIGSFSRENVLSHRSDIPDIERRIVSTMVPCLTFESLCRKHGVEKIDLLLVDTEGYDFEIIKRVDFARHRPRVLIYEHYHLSEAERAACASHLEGLGYEMMEEWLDTLCLDVTDDDDLTRRWRELEPLVPGASAREKLERAQ